MNILLTNDDGYNAPGILALYETLSRSHEVLLIAPDREKSGISHGISLNTPLRMDPVRLSSGSRGYTVNGTPADCVKLALAELFSSPPDLIVSGINPGSNTGVDINYSGTVGAAREGAINRISSLAVSVRKNDKVMDFQGLAGLVARIAAQIGQTGLPSGTFLNINAPGIPMSEVPGIRITRQAMDNVSKQFEKRLDPKNRAYYWYGPVSRDADGTDTDVHVLMRRYISITPIQCDMTNYQAIKELDLDRFM